MTSRRSFFKQVAGCSGEALTSKPLMRPGVRLIRELPPGNFKLAAWDGQNGRLVIALDEMHPPIIINNWGNADV